MIAQIEIDRLLDHAPLAVAWLTWRPNDDLPSPTLPLSALFSRGRFPFDAFVDHLSARDRAADLADIQYRVETFQSDVARQVAAGHPALNLLWLIAFRGFGLRMRFESGAPRIDCSEGLFSDWIRFISEFDPDAIACLELALRAGTDPSADERFGRFETWPLNIASADPDLAQLLEPGASDMHLHMKSLAAPALNWRRILADRRVLENARRYQKTALGAGSARRPELQRELDFIRRAIDGAGLETLESDTQKLFFRSAEATRALGLRFRARIRARTPREILAPYRRWLFETWRTLTPNTPQELAFGRYLSAKMLYRQHHIQQLTETNPGLAAFEIFRRRNSHLGRFHDDECDGAAFSLARFFTNNALLTQSLAEDRNVRSADLRVAPPAVFPSVLAKSYAQMAAALDALNKEFPEIDIGSSVHFKRFLKPPSRRDADAGLPDGAPILRKIIEYDLETAGFQQMRRKLSRLEPQSELAGALAVFRRVDLASPERGSGPWLIAPFVRLLRGDPQTLEELAQLPDEAPYALRWKRLARHHQATPPHQAPPLRLSCHAGEDFDTLVQGLRHIERAYGAWGMRPGDGLGHCLALGPSLLAPGVYDAALRSRRTSCGNDLDSLVWLLDLLERNALGEAAIRRPLREAIAELAETIYGPARRRLDVNPASVETLIEKVRAADKLLPLGPDFSLRALSTGWGARIFEAEHLSSADRMRMADLIDPDVAARRERRVAPHRAHALLQPALRVAQEWITDDIEARGLVIETNPSSNWRIRRAGSPSELPLLNLMSKKDGPRITICTDNPGLYDISVSSEYALLFEALQNAPIGLGRNGALRALERMRRTGRNRVSWRRTKTL